MARSIAHPEWKGDLSCVGDAQTLGEVAESAAFILEMSSKVAECDRERLRVEKECQAKEQEVDELRVSNENKRQALLQSELQLDQMKELALLLEQTLYEPDWKLVPPAMASTPILKKQIDHVKQCTKYAMDARAALGQVVQRNSKTLLEEMEEHGCPPPG